MFTLDKELKKIEDLSIKAKEFVNVGEFRKARRILKPIENSFCISESTRAISFICAEILRRQGKFDEAIDIIKANIYYFWNLADGFTILNCKNPQVNEYTSLYNVNVFGGTACLGAFTCFPENYKTSYYVLAQSNDEILGRILELGIYAFPEKIKIETVSIQKVPQELLKLNHGVVKTFPFEKFKDDEPAEDIDFDDEFDFESWLEGDDETDCAA